MTNKKYKFTRKLSEVRAVYKKLRENINIFVFTFTIQEKLYILIFCKEFVQEQVFFI